MTEIISTNASRTRNSMFNQNGNLQRMDIWVHLLLSNNLSIYHHYCFYNKKSEQQSTQIEGMDHTNTIHEQGQKINITNAGFFFPQYCLLRKKFQEHDFSLLG